VKSWNDQKRTQERYCQNSTTIKLMWTIPTTAIEAGP